MGGRPICHYPLHALDNCCRDRDVDFGQYKTFRLVKPKYKKAKRQAMRNPIFTQEIMREIVPILESKGYKEADAVDDADLLIHFYTFIKNRRDYVAPTYRVGRWGRTWVARPGR